MSLQRTNEAQSQGQRAADLDPMNPLLLGLYGVVLADVGNWEAAFDACEKALTLDPGNFFTLGIMEMVAFKLERYEASYHATKGYLSLYLDADAMNEIDKVYREEDYGNVIQEMITQLEIKAESVHIPPHDLGMRYILIGQKEKALEYFEKGFEIHDPNMPYLAVGFGQAESLYDNPRFIAILEKMNLPAP